MERVIAVDVGALESLQDVRNSLTGNVTMAPQAGIGFGFGFVPCLGLGVDCLEWE